MCVDFVNVADDVPVAVLELEVVPRPLIIDRTFRHVTHPLVYPAVQHTLRHHCIYPISYPHSGVLCAFRLHG